MLSSRRSRTNGGRAEGGAAPDGRNEGGAAPDGRNEGGAAPDGRNEGGAAPDSRDEGGAAPDGGDEGGTTPDGRVALGLAYFKIVVVSSFALEHVICIIIRENRKTMKLD